MNDLQIKCFLEASKCRSFSEAAEKVYMTPPTFGRYISSLEQELGYPLFIRGWKSLRLTAAGEIMQEGFKEIQEKLNTLRAEAERLNNGQTGQLILAMLEGQMLDKQLRTALRYFGDTYPDLLLKLERYSSQDMTSGLEAGKIDIGIMLTIEAEQSEDLDFKPFCTLPNYMVMPRDHPLAEKKDLKLLDFKREKFVETPSRDSLLGYRLIHDCCRAVGFEPRQYICPDFDAQLLALETGMGVIVLNENHVACNNPALIAREIPGFPAAEFCAAWHKGNPNPAVKLFLNQL